jgi:hypothetical protein
MRGKNSPLREDTDKLAPAERRALEFARGHWELTGVFPSREQVGAHMGWKNTGSMRECFWVLAGEGYCRKRWGGRRWEFGF